MDGIYVGSDVGPQAGVQPVSDMLASQSEGDVTSAPVRVTDGLIDAILARLATISPERGGALLAAGGLVHLLVEDSSARYSRTSWDISAALSATVGEIEAAGHGTLAGTVHTHPPGVPEPSSADIATTRDALRLNPHLGELLIAIVTEGTPREHDLPVGSRHRMSLYMLRRNHTGQRPPVQVRGAVVPLAADLAAAGITIASATSITSWRRRRRGRTARPRAELPTVVTLNHDPRLAVQVRSARPAVLLIHPGYPQVGPIAVTGRQNAGSQAVLQPLPSPWDPVTQAGPQLAALARAAAGRRIAGSTKRVWPVVGALSGRRVLIAGAGSVGSRVAEDLVRSGVGAFTVIDPNRSMRRTLLAPYIAPPISACPSRTRWPDACGRSTRR